MARQIVITLSDEEYDELEKAAAENDTSVEALAYRRVALESIKAQRNTAIDPVLEKMFLDGLIEEIPTGEPDTPEDIAALERLARSVKPGKSASEMVIEDRGPR